MAQSRVADLVAALRAEEKVALLMHESPAIPRLGIDAYDWWSECLHGVARAGVATVFPQAIALAATFDTGLVAEVYEAVATEALYKHRLAGRRERYWGLTFCTPNVNIFRDPRWGRGHETFGEDPFLTGAMARATIRGLQGPDPESPRVAACAKHFAVHSGPEALRHGFDVPVTPKDLQETYLPAFKASVDAGVAAVMPAYNAVNGAPCCASAELLQRTLRGDWGFRGLVMSDAFSIADCHQGHGYTRDEAESAAAALRAGCDLEIGRCYRSLAEARQRNLIGAADIDRALTRVLSLRERLGVLGDTTDGPGAVDFDAHSRLTFSFEIGNDSDIAGEEVIQLYFSAEDAGIDAPQCQLVGFERCHFAARETKRFERTVGSDELALVDADGTRAPRPGRYTLHVSASSPGRRARTLGVPQLSAPFTIRE